MLLSLCLISAVLAFLTCYNTISAGQCDDSSGNPSFLQEPDVTCAPNHDNPFLKAVSDFKLIQTQQLLLGAANDPSARLLVFTIGCGETSNHLLVRLGLKCQKLPSLKTFFSRVLFLHFCWPCYRIGVVPLLSSDAKKSSHFYSSFLVDWPSSPPLSYTSRNTNSTSA
jgi:hypothetical protein